MPVLGIINPYNMSLHHLVHIHEIFRFINIKLRPKSASDCRRGIERTLKIHGIFQNGLQRGDSALNIAINVGGIEMLGAEAPPGKDQSDLPD